jgi:hypothetical protein
MDEAQAQFSRIKAELDAWPVQDGIKTTDLMTLSEPLRSALNTTVRESSMTLVDFAKALALPQQLAIEVVDLLVKHGFLRTSEADACGAVAYHVRYARAGRKVGNLWNSVLDALDDSPKTLTPAETTATNKRSRSLSVLDLLSDKPKKDSAEQAKTTTDTSEATVEQQK